MLKRRSDHSSVSRFCLFAPAKTSITKSPAAIPFM